MKAMGLHRLAETAAALLKRNTGLVAVFGDGCGSGDGGVEKEDGVKVEGGVKIEGGVCGDIEMEIVDEGVGGNSSGVSSSSSSGCVIKSEPDTDTTTINTDLTTSNPAANTTTANIPRNKGTRTRGKSTISRVVNVNGTSAIVYSGDGAGCVDSGSPARIKLEPISPTINHSTTNDKICTRKKVVREDENDEPASVKKKRQKIQEIMEKIKQEEALDVVNSEHVIAVAV